MMTDSTDVQYFQIAQGLAPDGICGPQTRVCMAACRAPIAGMGDYGGTWGPLVQGEGFRAEPYWPGGASGVTIAVGWDLRWQDAERLALLWGELWSAEQLELLQSACGLRGEAAREWVMRNAEGASWGITPEQAGERLPACAEPYWSAAVHAWPELPQAPSAVQSVALSACYSAWLTPVRAMRSASQGGDWRKAALARMGSLGDSERCMRECTWLMGTL